MSHLVTSSVIITDLDCLKRAVANIKGLRWHEKKTYAWFGQLVGESKRQDEVAAALGVNKTDFGKCEAAISVEGAGYEIGVMKRKDGKGYSLAWDYWGPGEKIPQVIGAGGEKLVSEYQRAFITRFAQVENMNLTLASETDEEITLELEVEA